MSRRDLGLGRRKRGAWLKGWHREGEWLLLMLFGLVNPDPEFLARLRRRK